MLAKAVGPRLPTRSSSTSRMPSPRPSRTMRRAGSWPRRCARPDWHGADARRARQRRRHAVVPRRPASRSSRRRPRASLRDHPQGRERRADPLRGRRCSSTSSWSSASKDRSESRSRSSRPAGSVEIERHRRRLAAARDADLRPGRLRRERGHAAAHGRRDRRRRIPATCGTTCSRGSLTTARAFGLQAIDGPYAAIRDLDGFREVGPPLALARLRRQVGDPPGSDRQLQRDLRADGGRVRARRARSSTPTARPRTPRPARRSSRAR